MSRPTSNTSKEVDALLEQVQSHPLLQIFSQVSRGEVIDGRKGVSKVFLSTCDPTSAGGTGSHLDYGQQTIDFVVSDSYPCCHLARLRHELLSRSPSSTFDSSDLEGISPSHPGNVSGPRSDIGNGPELGPPTS